MDDALVPILRRVFHRALPRSSSIHDTIEAMERVDGYAPIREYAIVGDGRTGALVARDGSVDWLCLPNVDSPTVFARILDAERGGSFRLEPTVPFEAERRYQESSNVLETTFTTAEGRVRVTDAMTLTDITRISPMRELVRKVEALGGTVPMKWAVEPRFGYTCSDTRIERRSGRWFARSGSDAVVLGLSDAGEGTLRNGVISGELSVTDGSSALLSRAAANKEPAVIPGREDSERRLARMGTPWSDAEETPLLEAPGFLLMNYGERTVIWTLLTHVAYGAIVGGFAAQLG